MSDILRKLFLPPIFEKEDLNRTARVLNVIIVALFLAALLLPGAIYLVGVVQNPGSMTDLRQIIVMGMGLTTAATLVGVRRFMYQGRLRLVSWLVTAVIWLGLTLTILQFDGLHDNTIVAFSLVIAIPTVLLRERKAVAIFTLLTLLAMGSAFVAEVLGIIVYTPRVVGLADLVIISTLFVILGVVLAYTLQNLNRALERAETSEAEAAEANNQLQQLNADLEARVAARTQALVTSAEIGRHVSTILDKVQLVKEVADEIRDAFDYYQVHLYLLNEKGDTLELAAGAGHAGAELVARRHTVPVEKGLVGRAVRTNEPVLAPDVTQVETWLPNPLLPDTRSEVTVPIALGDKVLGVLDIQQNRVYGLGEGDADLLLSISGQVAVALQNARLLAEAQARAEQEALINQIGQQIQSATTVERAMQIAVREVGRAVNAPHTRVRLGPSPRVSPSDGPALEVDVENSVS